MEIGFVKHFFPCICCGQGMGFLKGDQKKALAADIMNQLWNEIGSFFLFCLLTCKLFHPRLPQAPAVSFQPLLITISSSAFVSCDADTTMAKTNATTKRTHRLK